MIAYFDTSAIVPLVVEEAASATAASLWRHADRLVSTRLVYAEGRAALARARREGRISATHLTQVTAHLGRLYGQLDHVEVSDALVRRAGDLSERFSLRGYDAVHLAAAERLDGDDVVLVSGDVALCAAARSVGLATAETTA